MAPKSWKATLLDFVKNNQTFVVVFFSLPVTLLLNVLFKVRKFIYTKVFRSPAWHDRRVCRIQRQVQRWNKLPKEKRKLLSAARPHWLSLPTVLFRSDLYHRISVDLFDILELDDRNLTVRLEPLVTVGDMVEYLAPKGYALAVTPEIADIAMGRLVLGGGVAAQSHKAGLFHETVVSFEVVLADGSLATASKVENHDLYNALMYSHETLAVLVAVTVKIVKVKPYVKITYTPVKDQKEYCDKIREVSGANNKDAVAPAFIEMMVFSKNKAVIITGEYSYYDPSLEVNVVTEWYKTWFYKYAESTLHSGKKRTELIPLPDYLLRHNRSIFWVLESMLPHGNNPLTRFLFGWLLPPKPALVEFIAIPGVRAYPSIKHVFQDVVLPISELCNQINLSEKLFDLYPLLVYPCRVYDNGQKSSNLRQPSKVSLVEGTDYAMYNNLRIYGVPGHVKKRESKYHPVKAMREMEEFATHTVGFSFLYTDTFMTREEFRQMFDLSLYEEVRRKYGAEGAFPHVYDKVKPDFDVLREGSEVE